MTARQREKAERDARKSLERLLLGWQGALLSAPESTTGDMRRAATEAAHAARRAFAAGTPADQVVRDVIAPVFATYPARKVRA